MGLYYISLLLNGIVLFQLLSFNGGTLAQQEPQLPQECGKLNESLLYNRQQKVDSNEYPWLGLLGRKQSNITTIYDCVAVLISQRYIIVPAHCIGVGDYPRSVVFGNDINIYLRGCDDTGCVPPAKVYYLEEIVPHFQYSFKTVANDIGLAKLKENVEFSDYVQPICLPPSNERDDRYIGQRLELAGYPYKPKDPQLHNVRIKSFIYSASHVYCHEAFGSITVNKNLMCGDLLGDTDFLSGSAVMGINVVDGQPKSFYLLGILTFGRRKKNGPPDSDSPVGYQLISPFRDLLVQNMI